MPYLVGELSGSFHLFLPAQGGVWLPVPFDFASQLISTLLSHKKAKKVETYFYFSLHESRVSLYISRGPLPLSL